MYKNRPQAAVVFCVDEKGRIQAIERTQPAFPDPARHSPPAETQTTFRHGVTSLFVALDVATGKVIGQTHSQHRNEEFRRILD